MGFFLLGWTIFTVYMTVAAWRTTSALFTVFVLLSLTFLGLTLADLGAGAALEKIGGWLGLLTALGAWYCAAAGVLKATWGRTVLEVGPRSLRSESEQGRAVRRRGHPAPGGPLRPTTASSDSPNVRARAATVKKVGVGMRPVSILRRVSAEIPAAFATSTMLRSPRACRNRRPSRTPRSRSDGVKGTRTMRVIVIPV